MRTTYRLPEPGTILGYRKDGRPIYPIAGASPEGDPAPAPPAGDPPPAPPQGDPAPAPAPAPAPGEDRPWDDPATARKVIEDLRRENASVRTKNKELTPLAEAARKAEEEGKSELERARDALAQATARADQYRTTAVTSRIEALAAKDFIDAGDAAGALNASDYVDENGVIDEAKIKADLDKLREQKPHWAAPAGPRRPAPDPGQGARPGQAPGSVDEQIAEAKRTGDWRTAMRLENTKLAAPKAPGT